jgi:hypothetical protein
MVDSFEGKKCKAKKLRQLGDDRTHPFRSRDRLPRHREGDEAALARLTLLVHQELRLFDVQHVNWRDRSPFMAMAARMMRRILVEFARAKIREKHVGG